MVTRDIAKIILDEFERCEMNDYREIKEDIPFYVLTFRDFHPMLKDAVKDKKSLAECLAACFMGLNMNEDEIRNAADKIFKCYDDADIVYDCRDEDGY